MPEGAATIASVAALDALVLPAISAWDLLGLELLLIESVAARRSDPALIVYTTPGRTVSLGRYHLYDGTAERGGISATRRLSGGRAVGTGQGWAGVAVILPDWGALLPERDANLQPDQVMNRYGRALLTGLRTLGLGSPFYPGRDAITVERREIAMCSFETDASGALLFEASLAIDRGMEELGIDLDQLDPSGSVPSVLYSPETSTNLTRELGRSVTFEEVSNAILQGYSESLGAVTRRETLQQETAQAVQRGKALAAIHWLRRMAPDSEYNRKGRISSQLGQIEARLRVSTDNHIERAILSGDFIANSRAIAELEAALESQSHDLVAISNTVTKTFSTKGNYLLGAGDLSNLIRLLAEAQ